MCRQGASVIQNDVLGRIGDPTLRVYVAWVPILPDDSGEAAAASSALVPDVRARHFWDASRTLPPSFAPVLVLPKDWPAWDVYLAYPAGATWDATPPTPAFWHHQLGDLDVALTLDGAEFAKEVQALL